MHSPVCEHRWRGHHPGPHPGAKVACDPLAHGVSAAHWLLSPAIVAALRQDGREVFAWTVNQPERALTLVEWGVDGVISDRLDLLAALP